MTIESSQTSRCASEASATFGRVTDSTLFLFCNYGVIPFWFMLVAFPRSRWTARLVHSAAPAVLLVPIYVHCIFFDQPGPVGANFWTLEGVRNIFTTPHTVLGCWIHYLVFDLFVGAWMGRDAARRSIRPWMVAPCQLLTLMFGPMGLFSYVALRAALRRTLSFDEDLEGAVHGEARPA